MGGGGGCVFRLLNTGLIFIVFVQLAWVQFIVVTVKHDFWISGIFSVQCETQ